MYTSTQPLILLRSLEKLDDFHKLFFRLIDSRDVIERYSGLFFDIDLGLALANLHQTAGAGAHFFEKVIPQEKKEHHGYDPRQHCGYPIASYSAFESIPELFRLDTNLRIFTPNTNKRKS